MKSIVPAALAALLVFACSAAIAAEVGAILLHGKWSAPGRNDEGLALALKKAGYEVVQPEMPWSRRRNYDRTVEAADAEVDAAVDKLKAAGAKRIVLVGHSLGAAFALHYAGVRAVDALVAIAPGHRIESPAIAQRYASDVSRARDLVAGGRGDETVSFTDFNTGGRSSRSVVSAASFVSYFDPAGPLNIGRNVDSLKPLPVLWIVPSREEAPLREGGLRLYQRIPQNALNQLAEPAADHMQAPDASIPGVIEWLRKVFG